MAYYWADRLITAENAVKVLTEENAAMRRFMSSRTFDGEATELDIFEDWYAQERR